VFTVSTTAVSFKDFRQHFTRSFCMNINSRLALSSPSGSLQHKFVRFQNVLNSGELREKSKYSRRGLIYKNIFERKFIISLLRMILNIRNVKIDCS
jgi:hypothetical protein